MDDRRFDGLVKAAARGGSRRQLLRRMLGGLAASVAAGLGVGRAGAQEGYLALGAPCYADWQCDQSEQPTYCADNQFDYDSPYNCCLGQYGYCGSSPYADSFCCGSMVCNNGYCAFPTAGPLGQGDRCTDDSQCVIFGGPPLFCEPVGLSLEPRCCAFENTSCWSDDGCCGDRVCVDGFCRFPTYFLGPGDACLDDSSCSAAGSNYVCANNGFRYDGPSNCCTFAGNYCGAHEHCCGRLACLDGICQ